MDYKMIKMFKIINETDLSKKYDELMSKKDNLHWEEYIYNSEDIIFQNGLKNIQKMGILL